MIADPKRRAGRPRKHPPRALHVDLPPEGGYTVDRLGFVRFPRDDERHGVTWLYFEEPPEKTS